MADSTSAHPLSALSDTERDFILHLVLASGSLKDLAQVYGVSYPTIRARLNRLIGRLEDLQQGRPGDPMSRLLTELIEKREVSPTTAQTILELHYHEMQSLTTSTSPIR
jgi:hypothetical protein